MSDLLDELHAQAGLELLIANPMLGPNRVFDGVVPSPTPNPPYVMVYCVVEWPPGLEGMANSLDHLSVTCRTTYYCHGVGATAAAARGVGMQIRSSLLDVRPSVAGRVCSMIEQIETVPPQRDESTGVLVMDAISVYSFASAPG